MRKLKLSIAIILIACYSLVQTGCIGSFSLTNKVLDFNREIGSKFANEAVFLAFLIIPVYSVTTLVDALVLNTIEFWTGDNPVAHVNDNNELIDVKKTGNKYTLNNRSTNEQLEVYFDNQNNTVFAEVDGKVIKLVEYCPETNEAVIFLPDGESQLIDLNNKSTSDLRNELNTNIHLALN